MVAFYFGFGEYFLGYRNNEVFKLRTNMRNNYPDVYPLLPTYEKMLYSFKPLKLQYWLDCIYKQRVDK